MKQAAPPDKGWRGSRQGWLDAAYEALIEGGIDAVKIQPLARRLGLSRTSFYWFFGEREALMSALIAEWEARTTAPLVGASTEYAETQSEAMLNVLACFLTGMFDAPLEFAVRSWALQEADIGARTQAADTDRLAALRDMLIRWGHAEQGADVRARTIYLTQIGYISMQAREDLDTRLARIPTYVRIFTGQTPTPREIARFNARVLASADGNPAPG
ncbi:MAG: TetR family transcriptional regulator [Paracoccus sp.]|uniref:TetR/AcrR family transcriptional regulator n=1 Tax=Paracoccus sp. TaxID=267 RepID=UPI000C41AC2E|nr:TetR family transcriptional regulator [Paracoccus sp. (in: a-proteobacteria)]|tara:strand:+ start:328 stop:975 length:648 start_codon:yes stop_codon:yes gene_type:complete